MSGMRQKGRRKSQKDVANAESGPKPALPRIRANPSGIFLLVPMMLWGGGDVKWEGEDRAVCRASAIIKTTLSMDTYISGFLLK